MINETYFEIRYLLKNKKINIEMSDEETIKITLLSDFKFDDQEVEQALLDQVIRKQLNEIINHFLDYHEIELDTTYMNYHSNDNVIYVYY